MMEVATDEMSAKGKNMELDATKQSRHVALAPNSNLSATFMFSCPAIFVSLDLDLEG